MTQVALSGVAVERGGGGSALLDGVTFTVAAGERWGIVGRNGSGKTTLFEIITGALEPTRGAVARQSGLRISLLEQHRTFEGATTVWEAAAGPFAELLALEQSLADQASRLAEEGERVSDATLARYDRDLERFEREGGYTFAPRIDAVLHGLGFDPAGARSRGLDTLSGGERGRVGLARQLVAPADVLLLDEPTNHLDLDTTRWLEEYLRSATQTVLLISHDRTFLAAVVDHVLHVEAGTAVPYTGGYESFVAQRAERRLTQQRAYDDQRRTIEREQDYVRRNIAGQNSRQAKGRRTRLARVVRLSAPPGDEDVMALRLEPAERGGDQVVIAADVSLTADDRTLLRGFTGVVRRGEIVGLIGANGAGKSTLLRTVVGESEPAAGTVRLGGGVQAAHYRQDMTQVPTDRTLYDIIQALRPAWGRGPIQRHLARFGFSGDAVQRSAATLSGGERASVALAMIVLSRANLLVLDEPTNHLDVESIEALEDAVEGYTGTVLLVSHDRALLRALATRVWVLDHSRITDFDGSFAEWEVASAEREEAARVAAAEEEEARRVAERQRTRRRDDSRRSGERAQQGARQRIEETEAEITRLEARVAELAAVLEDPALYATAEGTHRAVGLGAELAAAQRALEDGFARWERAAAELDALGTGVRTPR